MDTSCAVFFVIDVGKGEHHAVGLDVPGGRLFDKALPNDETPPRAVFADLAAHGRFRFWSSGSAITASIPRDRNRVRLSFEE